MGNPAKRASIGAILDLGVALFALLTVGVVSAHAESAWFNAKGIVGDKQSEFAVLATFDSVPVFKGNHRLAPAMVTGQTYMAQRFSLEAQKLGSDTSFTWSTQLLYRGDLSKGALPEPIWLSAVRAGRSENEWTRILYLQNPVKVEFHSQVYGDGVHSLEEATLPEECLMPLSIRLMRAPPAGELKIRILAPLWERPYERRSFIVTAAVTDQKLKIDEVEAELVRFERDDGAVSEAWVSTQGLRLLRFKTFRGIWLERLQ